MSSVLFEQFHGPSSHGKRMSLSGILILVQPGPPHSSPWSLTRHVPCRCVCVFFEHVMENLVPIEHVDAAHQKFGTVSPCAMLHQRPRARPLAACSYRLSRRVCFPRWRLTHLCREARVPHWELHMCVRSRAPGQNNISYRSLRPNGLPNSSSFVDVLDETVTAPAVFSVDVQLPSWPMTTSPANGVRHGSL